MVAAKEPGPALRGYSDGGGGAGSLKGLDAEPHWRTAVHTCSSVGSGSSHTQNLLQEQETDERWALNL